MHSYHDHLLWNRYQLDARVPHYTCYEKTVNIFSYKSIIVAIIPVQELESSSNMAPSTAKNYGTNHLSHDDILGCY